MTNQLCKFLTTCVLMIQVSFESAAQPLQTRESQNAQNNEVFVNFPSGSNVPTTISRATIHGPGINDIVKWAYFVSKDMRRESRLNRAAVDAQAKLAKMQPFQQIVDVDLGAGDGPRFVWFIFERSNGEVFRKGTKVYVDLTPPKIVISHPTTELVTERTIDIGGTVKDRLRSISYSLENSKGKFENQPVTMTGSKVDLASDDRREIYEFKCLDVALEDGPNKIIITASDFGGYTSSHEINLRLDVSKDVDAPVIEIEWPNPLDEIHSKKVRIRGRINEPSASVTIQGTTPKPIEALVERNGQFWAYDIPLNSGMNTFTVTATDPAGNSTSESLTVLKSEVEIVINPPSEEEKSLHTLKVTGSISEPGHTVWVNGVKAQMKARRWEALNVPINKETGTAILQAIAIPNSVNGGNGYGRPRTPKLKDFGNPKRHPEPE